MHDKPRYNISELSDFNLCKVLDVMHDQSRQSYLMENTNHRDSWTLDFVFDSQLGNQAMDEWYKRQLLAY